MGRPGKNSPQYGTPEYRLYRTANRYGMTADQYMERLKSQDYKCLICKTQIDERTARVDHDPDCCENTARKNSCGKCVRGFLCHPCNLAVGHIENAIFDGKFKEILNYLRVETD